jgi:hypothetical protein
MSVAMSNSTIDTVHVPSCLHARDRAEISRFSHTMSEGCGAFSTLSAYAPRKRGMDACARLVKSMAELVARNSVYVYVCLFRADERMKSMAELVARNSLYVCMCIYLGRTNACERMVRDDAC